RGNNSVWDRSWQTTGSRTTPAIVDAISGQPITTAWNVCRAVGIPPRTRGRSRSALTWRVALLQELQDGTLLLEHLALLLEHLQLLDVDRVERRQRDLIGLATPVLARRGDASGGGQARFVLGGALHRSRVGRAMLGAADPPLATPTAGFRFVHLGA